MVEAKRKMITHERKQKKTQSMRRRRKKMGVQAQGARQNQVRQKQVKAEKKISIRNKRKERLPSYRDT